jgi:CheY-like chemotaxis protein
MKINAKAFPFALAFAAQTSARSFLKLTLTRANLAPVSLRRRSEDLFEQKASSAASALRTVERPSIYAVDEVPRLTELYTTLLEPTGHVVMTFNHRAKALVALKADRKRPALLITNYLGRSMPVDEFIQACRSIHPSLRILMASGFEQSEMRFSRVTPDRFIQKPFTPEEFQQAVEAALAV